MAYFNLSYIQEAYKSKYSSYLDDEDDDEDDEDKKPSSSGELVHLSRQDIKQIMSIVFRALGEYKQLKRCCDIVDLDDRDRLNDDGERETPYEEYCDKSAGAYIELINGDVFGGYPNFRSGGNDDFEEDSKSFVKSVNKLLNDNGIKAKFMTGPGREDEAISFGVKSMKEK